jgi:NADP-dependent 3-hydroxy acid dehydrogenase YdfG
MEGKTMGIMAGKVCVITGGAGSIGLESARLLLQEGAKVMLVGRNEENLGRHGDQHSRHVPGVQIRFASNE